VTTKRPATKRKTATKRKRPAAPGAKRPALIGPTSKDPVTTYARDVGAGKILAGRMVRLACARHLDDLKRQTTDKSFRWRFSAERAALCTKFFRDFLTLDDGSPFILMNWTNFNLGSLEGWVDGDNNQRFTTSYTETSKGSAKSPTAAGYGLYGLVGKDEFSAEVYALGVDGNQAGYLFKFAKRMADRSDALMSVLDVGEYQISWVNRGSFFKPLSAEGRSLDNKRPYLAIVDELHEHPTSVIPEKMRLGFKGRKNALLFEITNAGFDKTSVCWEHHDYTVRVLEKTVTGAAAERWFGYICHLDPCEEHRLDGHTSPVDGCVDCDDWTNPNCWLKVQPALDVTISTEQLQAVVDEARDRPATQSRTRRLSFCTWTQGHTVWIPYDRWDRCQVPEVLTENRDRACAIGFDMSEKLDLTAGVVAIRVDDDEDAEPETVELTEVVGEEKVTRILDLNFCIELVPFFWIPEDTAKEREKSEHVPFSLWRDIGAMRFTPGPVIDHDLIYQQVIKEIVPAYRPQRVGYDPHNATQFAVALRDKGKQEIAEVRQGRAMSETFKLFEALVHLKRVRHAGNPVLGWCLANAEPKTDRYENVWVEKPSKTRRIDGIIATVIALSQLVLLPARVRRKRREARVFTPGGFKPLIGPKDEQTTAETPS